ncbi:mitochondrial carrier domain-containing protein [Dissophora ornata]|nr:mitochondrial carrier domain-containing protein [Dissophora ornata]
MSTRYSFPPPGGAPNANSPNPLRPYYTGSDSPLQSYYNSTLSSASLEEELAAQNEINSQAAAKELASYGLVKYMTLAISAPFEVGQTLLQVQYLPNDDAAVLLPPVEGGVWKAVTDLAKHPTEGWMSLWKGQYTNWIHEMLHLVAQPTLEATLNDTFDLYDDTIPLVHLDHVGPNIATMVASHLVIGFILSPLELVRTRLIVQTASPLQRKYSGMVNCFTTIIQEEGASALWGGVNLFPTLIYHILTPLLSNSIPLVIDRVFKLSAADSPVLYSLAELGLNTIELLIRLPIETVRKRLQLQIQRKQSSDAATVKKYHTAVETRKRPYVGMVDCIYRIIKEEGGHHKRVSRTTVVKSADGKTQQVITTVVQRPWYSAWGVRGLYTGLGMHLTTNIGLFAVGAVTNLQDEGDDW